MLCGIVLAWIWSNLPAIAAVGREVDWSILLVIPALYLCSHVLRILRLILLTLDKRDMVFSLASAHALTAFPASLLPFKLGEVVRLATFFKVFSSHKKAIAVWLAERFGDVLVITIFILGFYLFKIEVSPDMRTIFLLFVLVSGVGLLSLVAVAKVLVYLNRHLVLTSLTRRGLLILRASHILRELENMIYQSLEGRYVGFFLLSILIWCMEIAALSLFAHIFSITEISFTELFASGLLESLSVDRQSAFGIYQSVALIALTIIFLIAVWLATPRRPTRG